MSAQTPGGAHTPGQTRTEFMSPAASLRSISARLEDEQQQQRRTSTGAAQWPASQGHATAQLLAAKDAEAAVLRQQLAQLTADFRYNLKLLEERDLDLERMDAVLSSLRQAAAVKDAAAAEASTELAASRSALRDKEATLAALEERHRAALELCDRQVADARAARDEEVARVTAELAAVQGRAAKQHSDTVARYEEQLTSVTAAEREVRAVAAAAVEEAEHVRSQLARAEARVAEQELGMQRMVGQFESALATLQQLEAQYDNLAADAEAAERLRLERITGLEAEAEALRSARTVLQAELDGATADLGSRLADSERALAEARQQYQRAMIDASELTEEVGRLRSEVADARAVAHTAKQEAATAREEHAQASAALEREMASHMHTQGLLVSARAALEAARRDLAAQQEEAGCLREAAALLEAQCNDSTRALEAAHVKLAAADKRGDLLAQQVEQERGLHEQLLAGREAELETRWVRALQGAQDERARLSAALEAANRQLATAHHDMETMRLQIAHLRLVPLPPSAIDDHLLTRSIGVPSSLGCAPAGADGADDGGESQELQGDASIAETASQGSPDVFADLPDYPPPPTASTTGRLSIAAARGRGNHQRRQREQLTTHIDGLAERLSGYERSVAAACQAGSAATEQLAQSSRAVPEQLQQRQADVAAAAAAAEQRARRTKLAEEHEAYENEAAQLDKQLVEKQRAVAQQEAELQQLREVQAALQQQQQHERRQSEAAASPSAVAALQPADVLQEQQHQQLPLSTGGGYAPLHADQLAAENATLRRQLAAMRLASLGPSPTTTSSHGGAPSGRSLSGGGTGGRRQLQQPTAGSNSWRPSTGTTLKNGEAAAAAAPNAGLQLATSSGTLRFTREGDPLARARQQVQAAKAYLRQAAEWGGGRQGREHQ